MEILIENNRAEYWQKYALNLKDETDALESELKEKTNRLAVAESVIDILFEKLEVLVEEIDLWRKAAGIEPLSYDCQDLINKYKRKKDIIK